LNYTPKFKMYIDNKFWAETSSTQNSIVYIIKNIISIFQ